MKICPVGAELFHVDEETDRQTDRKKLRVIFHNFVNVLKKAFSTHLYYHFKCLQQLYSFLVIATYSYFSPLDYMHAASRCAIEHCHYMCPSSFPIPPAASLMASRYIHCFWFTTEIHSLT